MEMESVGKHTYGHQNIIVQSWRSDDGKLKIGNFCSIAGGLVVQVGGNHRMEWISTYPFPAFKSVWNKADTNSKPAWSKGDVVIGNDVWIGQNVTILSGVIIGDGAVIGANTTVSKNVPPYAICVGNPCVVKKYRFTTEQIDKLLKIKWWEWSDEKINDNVTLLCSENIDKFIYEHLPCE